MNSDVNGTLRSIELLVSDVPGQRAAEKIKTYAAILSLARDIEANLDRDYLHHSYTFENIARLLDSVADLCGVSDFTYGPANNRRNYRIDSAIRMLDDPSRWPSRCRVKNHLSGEIVDGTADPQ